ncbi:hypothetical protein NLO88_01315 [Pseudomonas syringae]|nr:hypothetical protein [Pseudomonas syringae]
MAWPFLFEEAGESLEGSTGLQIIRIDRNSHGNSPIRQGVGFPLTIVEVLAKRREKRLRAMALLTDRSIQVNRWPTVSCGGSSINRHT